MSQMKRAKAEAEKKGYLEVQITGMEKWNYPSEHNDWGKKEGIRGDGTTDGFDVEGHSWTDINFVWHLNLLNPRDLKFWIKDFFSWLKDVAEIIWDTRSKPKLALGFIKNTLNTIGLSQSFWAITVQSTDVIKGDLAQEAAFEALESARPDDGRNFLDTINDPTPTPYREWLGKVNKKEDEIMESLTHEKVMEHIHKDYLKFGNGQYARKDDLEIVVIDKEVFPYDMKSGYSNAAIMGITQRWVNRVLGSKDVVVVEEFKAPHDNRLSRRLKAALTEVDQMDLGSKKDEN